MCFLSASRGVFPAVWDKIYSSSVLGDHLSGIRNFLFVNVYPAISS